METTYYYMMLSGVLTLALWLPYIVARLFVWGIPTFLNNYPENFPVEQPEPPLWAQRAQRAHLNMVETMPAFIAVTVAATQLLEPQALLETAQWAKMFFFARIAYAIIYIIGMPYFRTPVYLVSWFAILAIAFQIV
ncbi:MAG: MAPEG family protein [Psychrobium sp.]